MLPPDWLEALNSYVAIPFAAVGFIATIIQVRKARSSADAAKVAANEANAGFRRMSAASMISQLASIEQALEIAIDEQSRPLLRHLIHTWTWHAGACREYLRGDTPEAVETEKAVQASISAARILKPKIGMFNNTTDWQKETDRLRKSIGTITGNLGSISAQQTLAQEASDE